jgi:hypothetical protein
LQDHLLRAKARSQAIAEQYNRHYSAESVQLRHKLNTSGQYGTERPITFDGPLPVSRCSALSTRVLAGLGVSFTHITLRAQRT